MNKILVYVRKFKPIGETAIELKEGRIYDGVDEGECYNLFVDKDSQILIHKKIQSGPVFDADIVQITPENYQQFTYHNDDAPRITETFIKPIIEKSRKEFDEQQRLMMDGLGANIANLTLLDNDIVYAIGDVVSHIHSTFGDKYEFNDFPEIDMWGLMRTSPHGAGYNVGNSAKYIRRYLTSGFKKSNNVEDLYKAIHYLLFEISRRKFTEQ